MPISLKTKWNAGSAGDGALYSQAKIVEFRMILQTPKMIEVHVEFGDTVGGEWVMGATGHFDFCLHDTGTVSHCSDFVAANAAVVAQMTAALYAKLQELEPVKMAGTIQ